MTQPATRMVPATYKAALSELDQILVELEGDRIEVDELASKVERAAFLLTHCRELLQKTGQQVQATLARIQDTENVSGSEEGSRPQ